MLNDDGQVILLLNRRGYSTPGAAGGTRREQMFAHSASEGHARNGGSRSHFARRRSLAGASG